MTHTDSDARRTARGRLVLVALFVLFFGSALGAGLLRLSGWMPAGLRNHGELLNPPVDLRGTRLRLASGDDYAWQPEARIWRILVVAPASGCDAGCDVLLAQLDKVWRLFGHNADQVQVLWLGDAPAAAARLPELHLVRDDAGVRAALPGSDDPSGAPLYVLDPNGFVILRYAPHADPAGLRADVARLLKLKRGFPPDERARPPDAGTPFPPHRLAGGGADRLRGRVRRLRAPVRRRPQLPGLADLLRPRDLAFGGAGRGRARGQRDPSVRDAQGVARAGAPPPCRDPGPAGAAADAAGGASSPLRRGPGDRRLAAGGRGAPGLHVRPDRPGLRAGRRRRGGAAVGGAALVQHRPGARGGADACGDRVPGPAGQVDGDDAAQADHRHGPPAGRPDHVLAAGVDGLARHQPAYPPGRRARAAALGGRRHRGAGRADRPRRVDQRQLCRAGLRRRWLDHGRAPLPGLPALRRPVVAAGRLPRGLRAVARDRRGLRRRRARRRLAHRHPDGAPDDGGGGDAVPAGARVPAVPAAGHAWLGHAAGRARAGAGQPGHPQRQAVAAAARGGDAQRRRRGAAVRAGDPAGTPAGARAGRMSTSVPVWREYLELTKPRVVALLVFTALVGMFLAVPGLPPLRESVLGLVGIWLASSSAAAINHLI